MISLHDLPTYNFDVKKETIEEVKPANDNHEEQPQVNAAGRTIEEIKPTSKSY
jgi:hypothetical protein